MLPEFVAPSRIFLKTWLWMSDTYRTVVAPAEVERKIGGSRFVGRAYHVASAEAADEQIQKLRREHFDATHNCTAFRIDRDTFRYDDDGEPSRTAGPPILKEIDARDLVQTLVVVTRYFGGTKLGTGGLIRAYGSVASEALDAVRIATRVRKEALTIVFDYPDTGPAMRLVEEFDAEVADTEYGEDTTLHLALRASSVESFCEAFTEALAGRGTVQGREQ